jgi:hypothetical protein
VIRISPPDRRAEIVAAAYVASFIGLSVPIVGAGIALTEGVSPRMTLLGLATLIAAGIIVSATRLLGGADRRNLRAVTDATGRMDAIKHRKDRGNGCQGPGTRHEEVA